MPRAIMATLMVYIYLLKMQFAVCFKHLPDSVDTQIRNLTVHTVSKCKSYSFIWCGVLHRVRAGEILMCFLLLRFL